MLSYEELMRRRRLRRAMVIIHYSVMDGVPPGLAEKIAGAYLRGELEYDEALERIQELRKKYRRLRMSKEGHG